jgi:hypothetical protein
MAEFEDKLQSILSNPELMGQIMSMAGAMNQQSAPPPPPPKPQPSAGLPFDPGAMAGMMNMLKATQLDPKQRNLIQALRGFVPEDRLVRLEKAMQASLIAKFASAAMNQGGNHV